MLCKIRATVQLLLLLRRKGTEVWAHAAIWKADLSLKLILAILEWDSEQKSQECCRTEPGSETERTPGTVKAFAETLSDPSPCL